MKKREILSIVLFVLLILIIIMDSALILPNQVLIAADLDIFFDMIGIMIGVYTIVTGISVIIFGYFTDIIERKKLLVLAGLLWSIVAILHIAVAEFWHLFVLRIIAATATGVTTPLAISYLTDFISSKSRSKSFAFWSLCTTLASLFAGVFALTFNRIPFKRVDIESETIRGNISFIKSTFPNLLNTWQLPFFLLGICALILTILNYFITIEPIRASKDKYLEEV